MDNTPLFNSGTDMNEYVDIYFILIILLDSILNNYNTLSLFNIMFTFSAFCF